MKAEKTLYDLREKSSQSRLQFLFESRGRHKISKAIQYSDIMRFKGQIVCNLGFGNYDIRTDSINDYVSVNNGDAYAVFNTVLKSVL